MMKLPFYQIGFLQALGLVIYSVLVSGFIQVMEAFFKAPPGILGTVLMLMLVIFSAAVTGSSFSGMRRTSL